MEDKQNKQEQPENVLDHHPLFIKPKGLDGAHNYCPNCGSEGGVSTEEEDYRLIGTTSPYTIIINRSYFCYVCSGSWNQYIEATVKDVKITTHEISFNW
jgi:hypothetical protein